VLRYCVSELSGSGIGPDKEVVERLMAMALGEGKQTSLRGGVQAAVVGGKLVLFMRKGCSYEHELPVPGRCVVSDLRMVFRCEERASVPADVPRERRSRRVCVDAAKLHLPLKVRNVRAGDRFTPLGMVGTKKTGDYLTDKKVHRIYRDEIPVVCDKNGIVWLVGLEIADRVKVSHLTREVVAIEYVCQEKSAYAAV
jgi:tRNA(Ile)-lysidine synthase